MKWNCGYCEKETQFYSGLCGGCGMPYSAATKRANQPGNADAIMRCPACGSQNAKKFDTSRYRCGKCGSFFERADPSGWAPWVLRRD